jgi:hypothetical protein
MVKIIQYSGHCPLLLFCIDWVSNYQITLSIIISSQYYAICRHLKIHSAKKYMVVLNLCQSVYLVHQIYNRRRKIKTIRCISENNQLRKKNENKYIFVFSVYLRIFSFTYIYFLLSRHLIVIFLFVGLCSYLFYHSPWSTEEYKLTKLTIGVSE